MAAGQQVALQPALAEVLRQHLHHPAVGREMIVAGERLGVPGPVGDLEHGARAGSTRSRPGPNTRNVCGLCADHVAQPGAEHPGGLGGDGAGVRHVDGVVAEVRQAQVAQQQSAVGVRVGAHPRGRRGRRGDDVRRGRPARRTAPRAGSCASTPRAAEVLGVRAHVRRAGPGARARCPRPADRRPPSARSSPSGSAARSSARSVGRTSPSLARPSLDLGDAVERLVQRRGHLRGGRRPGRRRRR